MLGSVIKRIGLVVWLISVGTQQGFTATTGMENTGKLSPGVGGIDVFFGDGFEFQELFAIGGIVSGLQGSGLELRNNGGAPLSITGNGEFTFPKPVTDGSSYNVTVFTQPSSPSQTCMVTDGNGTVAGANVTNVVVNCTTDTFTIGGTISGLDGLGLTLRNNGGDDLSISADGSFEFLTPVADGAGYSVTVLTQPINPSQTCVVTNDTGTVVGANITNVLVNCVTNTFTVGGIVLGLEGFGLELQNNGGDTLAIAGNGEFTFSTPLNDGSGFEVTVLTQPSGPSQTCMVTNDTGAVAGANVTTVTVDCVTNAFTVGGNIVGLEGTGLELQNNGGDTLSIVANGAFAFVTPVSDGLDYSVTVFTQPTNPSQTCMVTNGNGTVTTANVTSVLVECVTNTYTVGGNVVGLEGSGLELQNNGGDNLTVTGDGEFTFLTPLNDGSGYDVVVLTQPTSPNQTCLVTSGNGILIAENVTTVLVECVTNTYTVGGIVTGLEGSGLELQNNGGDNLLIDSDGVFTFSIPLSDGSGYTVTVLTQPELPGQICMVTNESGIVAGGDVTNVSVDCVQDN